MITLRRGFTYTEIIVVMSIILGLFGLVSVNLSKPQISASTETTSTQLLAELKSQQLKAMNGDTSGSDQISAYGIAIESDKYTLFRGSSFNSADPENFVVPISAPLSLSTTFPGSVIVFTPVSGEISSFTLGNDSITVTHSDSSDPNVIQLNSYGVVTAY